MSRSFTAMLIFLFLVPFSRVSAQPADAWTLQASVRYALEHNISIRQSEWNERLARLQLQQQQLSQIPSVQTSIGYGRSFGRSVDPTSNQFVNSNYDFLSLSGSADVLLFGWFQKRNSIAAGRLSKEAAAADLDQLKNDVSLNVATGFLRALLAKEQIYINEQQAALSAAQLDQTRRFVNAGRLPELDAAQLEAQLASDSAALVSAIASYNSAILDIKALLNLDFETPYTPVAPELPLSEHLRMDDMHPEEIFRQAKAHFGSVRGSEFRYQAAIKRHRSARGALWPQLGLNLQMGTNYAETFTEIAGYQLGEGRPTGAYVPVDSLRFPVYEPVVHYTTRRVPMGRQLENNFRQTITFGLNIPIFTSWQAQYNSRQAKIAAFSAELDLYQSELTLKQDVYRAHNDVVNAVRKYEAAKKAASAADRAFSFAEKRYELGLTNTVEYLTIQNNKFVAASNLVSAHYDLIFKLKVIDYYLGKEIKL